MARTQRRQFQLSALVLLAVSMLLVPAVAAADQPQKPDSSDHSATVTAAEAPPGALRSASSEYSDDAATIRAQAGQYSQIFARGDAAALAAMWTEDGTFTDESGNEYKGRAAIEKLFDGYFKTLGPQPMDVKITDLRFPVGTVAIEEGTCSLVRGTQTDSATRYVAVHIKKDGKWLMAAVSETGLPQPRMKLSDLEWLVGTWTAKGPSGEAVHFKADWDKSHHFIHCASEGGGSSGQPDGQMQIIGVNPRTGKVIAWHFDSLGGIGIGRWLKRGDYWIEDAVSVEPDGTIASACYIFHKADDQQFTWRSTRRKLGSQDLPDTGEVTVTRDKSAS